MCVERGWSLYRLAIEAGVDPAICTVSWVGKGSRSEYRL